MKLADQTWIVRALRTLTCAALAGFILAGCGGGGGDPGSGNEQIAVVPNPSGLSSK